jgi:succinate-semialdehyde dehydrogenase/glutarate-semialdehyde dehydrogenase
MTTPPAVSAERARNAESRDAATGEVWRRFESADAGEVGAMVARARAAQPAWRSLGIAERVRVLDRFHRLLFEARSDVAALISRENGKPASEAMAAEVLVALDFARYHAREAPRLLRAERRRATGLAMWRKRLTIEREPYGTIAVISPWNYPFMLAAGVIIPALVAGNAVVLKPSELTPSTGERLVELLHEAGVPRGVCQVAQGAGETGAALCDAPVDKVFFTGSVATGRRVAAACARRLVPCVLELGGSDPAIVLDDAPLAHAARGIAWGRFSNCGQTCVAPKRVFVEAGVHDRFVELLADEVRRLRVGAGESREVGPLIRPSQRAALDRQMADALARGATVRARAEDASAGEAYFAPTVLTHVAPGSLVLREETFGPLLPVVPVRDEGEAIALANASDFGLSASVWTGSAERGRAVAERLEAGTVAINDSAVTAGMADVPHGGVKASGTGRSHGAEGLLECVRTKTVVEDRLATWGQAWWFGYRPERADQLDAFARLAHGRGLAERLGGLAGTVRLVMGARR